MQQGTDILPRFYQLYTSNLLTFSFLIAMHLIVRKQFLEILHYKTKIIKMQKFLMQNIRMQGSADLVSRKEEKKNLVHLKIPSLNHLKYSVE